MYYLLILYSKEEPRHNFSISPAPLLTQPVTPTLEVSTIIV